MSCCVGKHQTMVFGKILPRNTSHTVRLWPGSRSNELLHWIGRRAIALNRSPPASKRIYSRGDWHNQTTVDFWLTLTMAMELMLPACLRSRTDSCRETSLL